MKKGQYIKVYMESGLILFGYWLNDKKDYLIETIEGTILNINTAYIVYTEIRKGDKQNE